MNYFLIDCAGNHLPAGSSYIDNLVRYQIPGAITAIIMTIILEILFLCFFIYKFKKKDFILITLLLALAFVDRSMELIIRPFTQYFTGYETVYIVGLYTRMISSSYLIPAVALSSMALIKVSGYAMDIVERH